jgi:hypothetical protein
MANPLELKITRYVNGDALTDTLNGSAITLKHTYNPKPGDGETDISETVQLVLEGAQATVQSTVNTINRYLADARKRNANGYGDRVYIEARAGTAAEWRRSEITDGRISVTDDGMQAGLTSNARTNANLTITRRGWWENTAGTYLPIYNSNGTAASGTDWVDIYNCADNSGTAPAKRENYVKLAAAGISGDLAAPVTTWIREQTVVFPIQNIYVGKVTGNNGTAALSMANYYADFSGSADANCSGGSFSPASISTDAETELFSASLTTSATMMQLGGKPYHVMARFRDTTSFADVRLRLKILSGSSTVWNGPRFMLASTTDLIQDLGVVNLPPGMSSEWSGITLKLYGTRITGDTETINLDFLQYFGGEFVKLHQLVPSSHDMYKYGGHNAALTRYDDHIDGKPFMDMVGYGAASLTVEPGKEHAFMFLANGTASAPITNNMEIRMEYRPRWSSPL